MKKNIILITLLLLTTIGKAQNTDSIMLKINNLEKLVYKILGNDSINSSNIKKIDSLEQKNVELNKKLSFEANAKASLSYENTSLNEKLKNISEENNTNYANIENIVNQLKNENSSFSPIILKNIENFKLSTDAKNTLTNFIRLSDSLTLVKKYIDSSRYDPIINLKYTTSLNNLIIELKTKKINFNLLEDEITELVRMLNDYCKTTKIVINEINNSVNKRDKREVILPDLRNRYQEYGYLDTQIRKAYENDNFKLDPFKETCPTK